LTLRNIEPALKIENLSLTYKTPKKTVKALRNISFNIYHGEIFGLVGESGCGKSTLAFAIMSYVAENGMIENGKVFYEDEDILQKSREDLRELRGNKISMVYQDPLASLNPSLTVGSQIAEVLITHRDHSGKEARQKSVEILDRLNISDPEMVVDKYPHQLSGGMQQRVCIAMAICSDPDLLILDEPTTNLDVTTEAVITDLIKSIKQEIDSAILYISHDLGLVKRICDRLGIMYKGEIVEKCFTENFFSAPRHPYSIGLLKSLPKLSTDKEEEVLHSIPKKLNDVNLKDIEFTGCSFAPRCPLMMEKCTQKKPELTKGANDHYAACFAEKSSVSGDIYKDITPDQEGKTAKSAEKKEEQAQNVLTLEDVKKYFEVSKGWLLKSRKKSLKAVDGISLQLVENSTLAVVGESGCGKSTLAKTIMGLLELSEGKVYFKDKDISKPVNKRSKEVLRKIQIVFQNPDTTLNPKHKVLHTISRPLYLYNMVSSKKKAKKKVQNLLASVGLDESYLNAHPTELSGGEKQRVAIARAFAPDPEVVICDEPTSGLDVSVQASVLNLLLRLQQERGTSYIFISHDLSVVHFISDYVAVVYLGEICEISHTEELLNPPYHPYTSALLSAIPVVDPGFEKEIVKLEGQIPSAIDPPAGCRFHTRCPEKAGKICEEEKPPAWEINEYNVIHCHLSREELASRQKQIIKNAKKA